MSEEPLTPGFVLKHVEELDNLQTKAHGRLRVDLDRTETDIDTLKTRVTRLESVQAAPVDVGKLRFTPAVVAIIITTVLSAVGVIWNANAKSDIILIRMTALESAQADIKDAVAEMKRLRIADKEEAQRKLEELQRNAYEKTLIQQGVKK